MIFGDVEAIQNCNRFTQARCDSLKLTVYSVSISVFHKIIEENDEFRIKISKSVDNKVKLF